MAIGNIFFVNNTLRLKESKDSIKVSFSKFINKTSKLTDYRHLQFYSHPVKPSQVSVITTIGTRLAIDTTNHTLQAPTPYFGFPFITPSLGPNSTVLFLSSAVTSFFNAVIYF